MNTSIKIAALASVVVLGVIIGGLVFLTSDGDEAEYGSLDGVSVEETTEAPAETESAEESGKFRKVERGDKIIRGSVKVSVEVQEKTRERVLRNARVRVFRRSETDRIGTEIDVRTLDGFEGKAGSQAFLLEPGSYEVMAQAAGYTGNSMKIVLVKDQAPVSLVFQLERGNSISGIVVDRDRKPISGA